jgi:carbon monoxide dehydrogenase subunit G
MASASIKVNERVEVPAGPDRVWEMITDPRIVVECVPGASVIAEREDGSLEGKLAIKLGPTRVEFRGEAFPEFDAEQRQGTLVAQGADQQGRSRARATTTFRVEPTDTGGCVIVIDGTIELTGGLSGFLQTGGIHLTRRMMKEFGEGLASRLALAPTAAPGDPEAVSETVAPPVPAGKPINGFRILTLTAFDWARSFFKGLGRRRAVRAKGEDKQ